MTPALPHLRSGRSRPSTVAGLGALLILLGVVLVVSGCGPKDPLDLRIDAATPADFDDWWERKHYEFTPEINKEFEQAFTYVSQGTPRTHPLRSNDTADPFCQRVNRMTVRAVLITSYHDLNDDLGRKVLNEMANLQTMAQLSASGADESGERRREATAAYTQKYIDSLNARIEQNNKRIQELTVAAKR